MYKFSYMNGEPGKITAGCGIMWYPQSGAITISHDQQGTGSNVFHWSRDDKRLTRFIADPDDFRVFAEIIAEIHGLETQL